MKHAALYRTKLANGRPDIDGLVTRLSVPIPNVPDVLVYQSKLWVLHYNGLHEAFYREASVYHYQRTAIEVSDG